MYNLCNNDSGPDFLRIHSEFLILIDNRVTYLRSVHMLTVSLFHASSKPNILCSKNALDSCL
jgi:hypothetical protein